MQLLEHFKELTIRPKNAKELKGLILQLAIQGKLTVNWRKKNVNIEPASELLKRIQKEKTLLVKGKKIRKEKNLPEITKEQVPYEIPNSWAWCRMGDLFSMSTGKGYKKSEYSLSGIRLFQIANVSFGQTSWDTTVYLPENYALKYPEEVINTGDLVMALNRPLLKSKLKVAVLDENDGPSIIYQRVGKFNFHLNNMSNWMLNYLQSPLFIDWLSEQVRGINIPFVNQTKLYQHITVLPPLEEQKEIVKVVAILFKEVEQLEQLTVDRIALKEDFVTSALKQLTADNAKKEWAFLQEHFKSFFNEKTNIKKLRETVLQLAVQGKLTADWRVNNPDTEDASILLKRIQKEKAQLIKDKKIKKEKALPAITKDEIPYELPSGWVWGRLGNYIHNFGQKKPDKNFEYIDVASIDNHLGVIKTELNIVTPEDAPSRARKIVKKGCVLYSTVRPYLLNIACVDRVFDNEAIASTAFSILNPISGCSAKYLYHLLRSPYFVEYVNTFSKGVAYPAINDKNLMISPIAIPPLEEQKAIVKKVTALIGLCDTLEQALQQSQEHSEQLMQSVLREVFEGESKTVAQKIEKTRI